ncbi:hypothetical protein TNCV_1140661 [Trichonephila clavipes]|nr:hypothetical protein TNCV_1140661 [Trichonephila clavipes]
MPAQCRSRHLTMVQNDVVRHQNPRVAEQCDVNIHSLTHRKSRGSKAVCTQAMAESRSQSPYAEGGLSCSNRKFTPADT